MIAPTQGAYGVDLETISGDFSNQTGVTITKGFVGVIDIFGTSAGVDLAAADGPTSRWGRMLSPHQNSLITFNRRTSWFGVLQDDQLLAGETGHWVCQGRTEVQCFVSAADAAALLVPVPVASATNPGLYSLNEDVAKDGMLGLRDSQGGVDAKRRGIFMPDTYGGDDTDALLGGLFMGTSQFHFGIYI